MACHVPDEQVGRIIGAIILPDAWLDRVLAQVHLADDVNRVRQEREQIEQRLKRLAEVYLDGLKPEDEYRREKRVLEDQPWLWKAADMAERRRILMTVLDAVEEKCVVAIRPRPAFRPLFEMATTRNGSGVVLVKKGQGNAEEREGLRPMDIGEKARRVRGGDGGESNSPSRRAPG